MKIQYMSDLHLEFGPDFLPKNCGSEVLILAGDITTAHGFLNVKSKRHRYRAFFQHCSDNWRHVLYVGGNHELYGWKNYSRDYMGLIREQLARFPNVHVLENQTFELDDVLFAGATFWTDFFGDNDRRPYYMREVGRALNDYHTSCYSTQDTLNWHNRSKRFLASLPAKHKKIAVITHHAPAVDSVHPVYLGDPINAGYYSDQVDFIKDNFEFKAWFHGHMHHSNSYNIALTKVRSNPRGYAHEVNDRFDESLILEL